MNGHYLCRISNIYYWAVAFMSLPSSLALLNWTIISVFYTLILLFAHKMPKSGDVDAVRQILNMLIKHKQIVINNRFLLLIGPLLKHFSFQKNHSTLEIKKQIIVIWMIKIDALICKSDWPATLLSTVQGCVKIWKYWSISFKKYKIF